jgi:YesN/AraC family two-component response regulator
MEKKIVEYNTGRKAVVDIMADKTKIISGLHFHSSHEIYLTHSGPISCVVNDKIYNLKPNDMMVFAPSDIHMNTRPKDLKYVSTVFTFYPDKVCKLSDNIDLLMPFDATAKNFSHKRSLSEAQVGLYISMLEKMERLLRSETGADDLRQQLLLAEILLFLYDLYSDNFDKEQAKRNDSDELVFSVLNYINENISENLSLDHISDKFFISKNILNKHFKQKTGYTLGKYITNYRMYYARQMLEAGDMVNDIAWKVGYQNTSNFIRVFKKVIGITPGAYKMKLN